MELTLDQALQKGVEAHKAGKAQEADRYYTAILQANPKHPDANHNMGVLAVGVGKVEAALPFFKTALEANPKIEQFWLSYINALVKLDRMADAKTIFDNAKSNGAKGDGFDKLQLQLNTSSVENKNQIQEDALTQSNILDELKLDQALKLAKNKVKEGNNGKAKKIYQDILTKFPRNKKALDGIKKLTSKTLYNKSDMEEPPSDRLQSLVNLYTQGQYQQALTYALRLLKQFPNSLNLYNIIGAANKGLGKLDEAIDAYTKALKIEPDFADAYNNMGNTLQKQNKLEEAIEAYTKALAIKPDHAAAHYNIGASFKEQGKLEKAIAAYTKALSIKPDYFEAYNNMGITFSEQGKVKEAIEAYTKALSIKPDYAEAYNNMGNSLEEQGRLEEAIEAYTKAISIKPDYAEAYNNMGNALKEQGKLDQAVEAYNKALAIKPDYAEAYYNMGNALKEQGKLEEAIEAYNKALTIKPDYANAYSNMGNALKEQGKLDQAVEAYNKALSIKPDNAEAYNNMGVVLQGMVFKKPNGDLQNTIASILDQKRYVRPSDIAKAAISLLKLEPNLQKHLQLGDDEIMPNPLGIISDLSELSLLLKLMNVCPLPDLELEKLFKNLRYVILSNVLDMKDASTELLKFQSALASLCFTNEYVYNHTEDEDKRLHALEANLEKAFKNNEQPSPQVLLALASYKALNQYDWCDLVVVTDDIKEVFYRQVEEPNQEKKIKQDLPILEEITNNISLKVRDQYEESPYPRWVNLGLPLKPMSISKVVDETKLKLFDNKINEVEKPEILIAGCGTGQHSIGTASTFKSSKVLAIDLSLSSLAYAKRKTNELAIKNIEYMQADILDLGKLNKKFDIIESSGVLHHMNDPMAGWTVLKDCLKSGGLMRLGLYSELARQNIVKIRVEIKQQNIETKDAELRSFRDMIMKSEKDHHKLTAKSPDFYSLSTLKDLLFHVQEHRFTIPKLKEYMDALGLKFCGFETKEIVSHFKQTNTNKGDPYDLNKWQGYEEANPRAFAGMYQFWCQKVHCN